MNNLDFCLIDNCFQNYWLVGGWVAGLVGGWVGGWAWKLRLFLRTDMHSPKINVKESEIKDNLT